MTDPISSNASQPEGPAPTPGDAAHQPPYAAPVAPPAPPAPPAAGLAYGAPAQGPGPAMYAAPGFEAPTAPVSGAAVSGARPGRHSTLSKALAVILAPVLAIAIFGGGVMVGHAGTPTADPGTIATTSPSFGTGDPDAELALIEEAWTKIQDNYVDAKNLDNQELAYAAIRGMVDAVGDEGHTSFLTAEESKAVQESLSGSFVGIGIRVDANDEEVPVVQSVIPNTPAQEAGIKRGDRILAVDGTTTTGEALDETISRVRGPEGEDVTLTMGRDGVADFDVTITRKKFDLPMVSWAMVPDRDIAMIRLDQFANGAADGIRKAITEAKDAGAKAIVFDLRGNPGGYVGEAVAVASQFVGDGIVFQSFDRSGVQEDNKVEEGGLATDIPLVVLADKNSASSAEIVSGAIQDAGRAKVVGETTFGTGTVLGQFDLKDGSSMRIGVERWLTRNGRPIWHEGLEPDVTVTLGDTVVPVQPDDLRELTWQQVQDSGDAQLLKALELLAGN